MLRSRAKEASTGSAGMPQRSDNQEASGQTSHQGWCLEYSGARSGSQEAVITGSL